MLLPDILIAHFNMKYILIFSLLMVQSCLGFAQSFEGTWQGELRFQQQVLPLVFHIEKSDYWKGTMESLAQNSGKINLSSIYVTKDSIFIEVKQIGLSFRGRLGDKCIDGEVKQGALLVKMLLKPYVKAVRSRPQTPIAPYSYDTTEVTFKNSFDGTLLAGTLSMPKGKGPFPAVVLVTGSGPQDRDETIENHKPFKVIADYLTKQDIAVLRYDDRGIGKSTGDFTKSTTADFSKDALAALAFLKEQDQVDPHKIGIIGHSEGGLIALLLAGQQVENLAFAVSLAGPAIPMDSLLLLQAGLVGKSLGVQMSAAELARIKRNYALVGSDLSDVDALLAIKENMKSVTGTNSAAFDAELASMLTPWYRYFIRINPIPFMEEIKIPVFGAYGSHDIQVPMGANMESLSDHLPANNKHLLKGYEGLNHLFQQSKTGSIAEYAEITESFNEAVLADMLKWIQSL